jgi:hypothetical protein
MPAVAADILMDMLAAAVATMAKTQAFPPPGCMKALP